MTSPHLSIQLTGLLYKMPALTPPVLVARPSIASEEDYKKDAQIHGKVGLVKANIFEAIEPNGIKAQFTFIGQYTTWIRESDGRIRHTIRTSDNPLIFKNGLHINEVDPLEGWFCTDFTTRKIDDGIITPQILSRMSVLLDEYV